MREGWQKVCLFEVADLQMGETLIARDLTGEGLPVFSAAKDTAPWGYTSHARRRFNRGTIVVGARGTIGFPRLPDFDQFISTQTTIAVTPGPAADPAFLAHALARVDYSEVSAHQAVPMLTIGSFREVEVSLPPLDEQRRIADVLSAVDRAIAEQSRVYEAARTLSAAIGEGLIGGAQATRLPLSEIADCYAGGTPSRADATNFGGSIPWVKSGEVRDAVIAGTEEYLSETGLADSSARWVPSGAALVAMYGATAGAVGELRVRATTNQAVLACVATAVEPEYLLHALAVLAPTLLRVVQGSGQPNLSATLVKRLLIPCPTRERQNQICRALSTARLHARAEGAALAALHVVKAASTARLLGSTSA